MIFFQFMYLCHYKRNKFNIVFYIQFWTFFHFNKVNYLKFNIDFINTEEIELLLHWIYLSETSGK